MNKRRPEIPPFTAPGGRSVFVFEDGLVRVYGERGTEAVISVGDLAAFLEHCAEAIPWPSNQTTRSGRPED
jgi:hypothetical protein